MPTEHQHIETARNLIAKGELDAAETTLFAIIANDDPAKAEATCLLSSVYQKRGLFDLALSMLTRQARTTPNDPLVWGVLADLQAALGDFDAATQSAQQSLALHPSNSNLALKCINWQLNTPTPGAQIRTAFETWAKRHLPVAAPQSSAQTGPLSGRKLRVGYVSGDLRRHPVFFFIAPYLRHHDHTRFDVHVFMTKAGDEHTQELKSLVPHWHDVQDLSSEVLLDYIRQQGIDVLIDLSGHSDGHRLEVFQQRAAPVQLTWFGTVSTLGMEGMDYRLTDAHQSPPAAEAFYTERLHRLSALTAYEMPAGFSGPHPAPFHRNGFVTLISLNHERKIGDETLVLWREILLRNPTAGLMIVSGNHGEAAASAAFERRLTRFGLPKDRVVVIGRLPLPEFINLSAVADFALDSYPVSGGATTFHSLAMGLPVATIRPQAPVALYGYTSAILDSLGMVECIASGPNEYVDIVSSLVQDTKTLDHLRSKAHRSMQDSAYMAHENRVHELEGVFAQVIQSPYSCAEP